MMRELEIGWFLPTNGDTDGSITSTSDAIHPSMEHFRAVATACDENGFDYILIPVQTACWEAWVSGAMMVAQTKRIKPLIAARPGYINPALLAKMISTFDQLSGGRICINLIAGASDSEARHEGIKFSKEERYEMMDEEVTLLKQLWSSDGPVTFEGKYHSVERLKLEPKPLQRPYPPFYLGGGSAHANEISAKHANVHLFWGDTPENIAQRIEEIRGVADRYGRRDEIGFGMRLQIVCRDSEAEAWAAAEALIEGVDESWKEKIKGMWSGSEANRRMKEMAEVPGMKIHPHLWTGITTVRPGAGVAVVGNPDQVAATLQEFIDAGCHSFCLSGYPHHREAERFGRQVMPMLRPKAAAA